MAKEKTKELYVTVKLVVPTWLTKAEAKREVRTLINEERGYMGGKVVDGDYKELHIKAKRVE